jgi:hypothetical protein
MTSDNLSEKIWKSTCFYFCRPPIHDQGDEVVSVLRAARDIDQHECARFCDSMTPVAQFTPLQEES